VCSWQDQRVLSTKRWGRGPRLVALHGFTQSAASWESLAGALADGRELLAVDAPGHGGSAGVRLGLWEGADAIARAGGRGAYLGYSMGGRYALHVALRHPGLVTALVVVSTTAGLDTAEERRRRIAEDDAVARRLEALGVEDFLDWWLSRPLFSTLPRAAAGLEARAGGSVDGLAASLRLAGTGRQEPLWDRLGALSMPVLVVAGELDVAYLARAHRLVAAIGDNASLAVVAGAGHACHLERPEAWLQAVVPFLDRTLRPGAPA